MLFPFQFLALGTHFGKVFLLDIQGNVTQKFEIVSSRSRLFESKHWCGCVHTKLNGWIWIGCMDLLDKLVHKSS